jgi:TP901 family phage tail tape measure protein
MAKIKLDIETNFDVLRQAGSNLHSLNNEAEDLSTKMNKAFKTSTSSAEKFDNTVKEGVRDLNKLEKEAAGVEKVGKSFGSANKQAESFGSSLKTMATGFVAGTLITGALSKVGDAFNNAIQIQKEFEKSIQNLSAITGASGSDLEFYKQKALEMGVSVKGGAIGVVEAIKLIGSAKPELLQNKEALADVTNQAILLSKAAGLELPDAATRLTDAMNQFGASSDQAGMFVDTLAAGAKFGAAEVPQITEALLKFGVAAKSSNINVKESVAAIELLGEKGLKGAEAGTALRNVFAKMSATDVLPKEAKKQLEDAGINLKLLSDTTVPLQVRLQELSKIQGNANALTQVFGLENKNAAQSILQNLPRLKELTTQIGEQGLGSALEQATINTDTLDQQLLELGNQYDNMILTMTSGDFGELIKGFVKEANVQLKGFMQNIGDFATFLRKGQEGVTTNTLERSTIEAAKKMTEAQKTSLKEQLAGQIRLINIQLQNNETLTADQKEKYQEDLKNKATIFNALTGLDKKKVESIEQVGEASIAVSQEVTEADKKELEKRKKLYEDYSKALLDLQKKVNAAILEQADPVQKIELQRQGAQQELDLYKEKFIEIGKLNDANFKLSLEQQKQFEFLRNAINIKAAEESVKLEVERQNKIAQAKLGLVKGQGENLEASETNAISGVNLMAKPKDLSEVDFERIKQLQIIAIQKDFAMQKLALKQDEISAQREIAIKAANGELSILGDKQDEESVRKRKDILDNLAIVEEKYAAEGQAVQNATAKIINDLQSEQEKLNAQSQFDLASFFGVTPDELTKLTDGLAKFGQEIGNLIGQQLDFKLQANEKEVEASKKKQDELGSEIDDLKSRLENEKGLRDQGFANNTDRLQAEIDAKTKLQELEKEKEKQALEERKKIQKEKLLLDSILQLSNLSTAATSLFASLSPIVVGPVPVGAIIAGATIATMLGTFAASKVQALKAINEGNGFEKGGYTGDVGTKEVAGHVHGKEFVSTAKTTKKHRALLEALHADNDGLITKALLEELKGSRVVLDKGLPQELNNKKDVIRETEAKYYFKQDNSKMENELSEIKVKLAEMIDSQKNKTYKDQNDNLVEKVGSHKIIRKKRG